MGYTVAKSGPREILLTHSESGVGQILCCYRGFSGGGVALDEIAAELPPVTYQRRLAISFQNYLGSAAHLIRLESGWFSSGLGGVADGAVASVPGNYWPSSDSSQHEQAAGRQKAPALRPGSVRLPRRPCRIRRLRYSRDPPSFSSLRDSSTQASISSKLASQSMSTDPLLTEPHSGQSLRRRQPFPTKSQIASISK